MDDREYDHLPPLTFTRGQCLVAPWAHLLKGKMLYFTFFKTQMLTMQDNNSQQAQNSTIQHGSWKSYNGRLTPF